jgi:hypothetical protein
MNDRAVALPSLPSGSRSPSLAGLRSMLALEYGTSWAQATLLGMAEGHCRLLTHVSRPSMSSIMEGSIEDTFHAILNDVEHITGRQFFDQNQFLTPETQSGDGIDGLSLVISTGGPLRILVLGPGAESAFPTLHRASTILNIEICLPPDLPNEWYQQFPVVSQPPHLLLLCGIGPQFIATTQMRNALEISARTVISYAQTLVNGYKPFIVLAGSREEETIIHSILNSHEYVRTEPLSDRQNSSLFTLLGQQYEYYIVKHIPGFEHVQTWTQRPPLSAITALGRAIRFLAQRYATYMITVSPGATTTLAVGANPQGNLFATQQPLLGIRQGAGEVLRRVGYERIVRWLPFSISEAQLRQAVIERMLQPTIIAQTPRELSIDYAIAREAIYTTIQAKKDNEGAGALSQMDVLVGTGGLFANVPNPRYAVLLLLDAIQPRGITTLILDETQILTALGAISQLDRMAAADAMSMDALHIQLGVCVSVVGKPPPGMPAVRVVVDYLDGRNQSVDVLAGTIEVLPLGQHQRARLMLYPAPGVDVGLGPGERAQISDSIEGGYLGIIIDARGRPLFLPQETEPRIATLRQWYAALGI